MASIMLKSGGVSIRGDSHVQKDVPCQDAFCIKVNGDRIVVAVSDGAGSATHSDVAAARYAETVAKEIAFHESRLCASRVRELTIRAVENAKRCLSEHLNVQTRELAATMVGCVVEDGCCISFHVGDGALVVIDQNDHYYFSHPENGEYANETYFLTMESWKDKLRVNEFKITPASIFVMSDGVTPFALKGTELAEGFLKPIGSFLRNAEDGAGKLAVEALLSSDEASLISTDDKTLTWLFFEND